VSDNQRTGSRAIRRPALWLIVFVLSPLLLLILLAYGISALLLHMALWLVWGPLGRSNIAGDELHKVSHGDVKHPALGRGDLDQPQQRLGVGFCDPYACNRLAE